MDGDVRELLAQLGAELRFARIQANLTQADLSARAGVSRQLVNRIETGRNGEISSFITVANALGRRLQVSGESTLNDSEQAAMNFLAELSEEPGA
jgi:transcriptional regulator with XRE-family HTH domain